MNTDKEKSKIQNPKSKIFLGCQGWNYDDWITKAGGGTVFYPRGTHSNEMLALYAEIFDTVEVDSTFYAIPPVSSVENWYRKTPANFKFSLKMPQEITHNFELNHKSLPILDEFCERISELKEKLGAVLIQLAPHFEATKENGQNLREFLEHLPKEIHFAIEFRNREWLVDWTFEELEKNRVALCLVEGSWIPRDMMFEAIEKPTADFSYIRFMGERDLIRFDKIYRQAEVNLRIWKEEIEKIKTSETYIYFSNFYEGHAPESANTLKKMLGQKTVEASILENQGSLF
ncbi:MAG TPA: DUF72 domain-containing protein [Pyrinomonadaceae bacterium]|nr:DUF72 domain-containing protein [Pyrinomonadaceae bacterium]